MPSDHLKYQVDRKIHDEIERELERLLTDPTFFRLFWDTARVLHNFFMLARIELVHCHDEISC